MAQSKLEVADVFRAHGQHWRESHAGHISLEQLKVMSARARNGRWHERRHRRLMSAEMASARWLAPALALARSARVPAHVRRHGCRARARAEKGAVGVVRDRSLRWRHNLQLLVKYANFVRR